MSLLLLSFIVQSVFLRLPIFDFFQPNLFLIVLVASALRYGPIVGVFSGFSLGILQDVYTVEFLGANAFVKSVVSYVTGIFDDSHFTITYTSRAIFLWVIVIFHDILYGILTNHSFLDSCLFFIQDGLLPSVVTALLGWLFFYLREKKETT
jgi:rod shape-determining protein MreD